MTPLSTDERSGLSSRLHGWAKAVYAEHDDPGLVKILCEAADELDRLTTALAAADKKTELFKSALTDAENELGAERAKSAALHSQIEGLREALKPFAEIATVIGGGKDDAVWVGQQPFKITYGDLRRAASALSSFPVGKRLGSYGSPDERAAPRAQSNED